MQLENGTITTSNLGNSEYVQSGFAKSTKNRAGRKYLTRKAGTKLTVSLVISHLDYPNVILAGLVMVSLDKLQKVQNMAAK